MLAFRTLFLLLFTDKSGTELETENFYISKPLNITENQKVIAMPLRKKSRHATVKPSGKPLEKIEPALGKAELLKRAARSKELSPKVLEKYLREPPKGDIGAVSEALRRYYIANPKVAFNMILNNIHVREIPPGIRRTMVELLAKSSEGKRHLVSFIGDKVQDPEVRGYAIEVLSKAREAPKNFANVLERIVKDPNEPAELKKKAILVLEALKK